MKTLDLVLLLVAVGCFLAAAVLRPASDQVRIRLIGAGLAAFTVVPLIALLQTTS